MTKNENPYNELEKGVDGSDHAERDGGIRCDKCLFCDICHNVRYNDMEYDDWYKDDWEDYEWLGECRLSRYIRGF